MAGLRAGAIPGLWGASPLGWTEGGFRWGGERSGWLALRTEDGVRETAEAVGWKLALHFTPRGRAVRIPFVSRLLQINLLPTRSLAY